MQDLLQRLRDRGWRVTAQRRAVAEALAGANVHLTADEVHDRARAVLPEISRATVYNTLTELVQMGELGEVTVGGRAKRYDPNLVDPHQHLQCVGCGRLVDVHLDGVEGLRLPPEVAEDYAVEAVEVTLRVRCPDCRAAVTRPT